MPCVFITGSGRRVGKGLALSFAAKGWDIVLHYHASKESAEAVLQQIRRNWDIRVTLVQADVRNQKEVERAFRKAANVMGEFQVLVNNAGMFPDPVPFTELHDQLWDTVMNTNLRSQVFAAQEFLKQCSRPARIINIASLGGLEVWKQRTAYNVSKAAVIQLTKSMARELAPSVAVNCIAPGIIDIPEEPAGNITVPPSRIPMQRYGSIDDLFDAVYFFATCSSFITGQILTVDGGQHLV